MSQKPHKLSDASPGPDAGPSASRRRLLLGAGTVLPTVLTLHSGAAAAAVSQLTCLARATADQPAPFTPHDDQWVRAEVRAGDLNSMPAYCVSTPQHTCVDPVNPNQAMPGSRWSVNGGDVTAGNAAPINVHTNRRAYGLVYVDQSGQFMTLDPHAAADLQPITQSCWTSVMGPRSMRMG